MGIGLAVPNVILPLPGQTGSFYRLFVSGPGDLVAILLIALSLSLAIFRYRLYDIDLLINRTLAYGLLTSTLALIYFGGAIALQSLLRGVTSHASDVGFVGSPL